MLLAIDVGNTLTDFGFYEEGRLVQLYKTKSDQKRSKEEYLASLKLFFESVHLPFSAIDAIILSSVVPSLEAILVSLCEELFHVKPKTLGPGLKSGVRVNTDNPREVGADLIADAAGAKAKYGGNVIIADLGTATKMIYVGPQGSFEGCTIAPGISISMEALIGKAALLYEVAVMTPKKVLGKNTNDSINSGLTYGTAASIKGMADLLEKEVGVPCKRILTGGYASVLEDLLPEFQYDEHLLLDGLVSIYERNK